MEEIRDLEDIIVGKNINMLGSSSEPQITHIIRIDKYLRAGWDKPYPKYSYAFSKKFLEEHLKSGNFYTFKDSMFLLEFSQCAKEGYCYISLTQI